MAAGYAPALRLGRTSRTGRLPLSATAYLKQASFRKAYANAAADVGLPVDLPAATVVADIYRPEWLCELELCAARLESTG